MSFLANLFKTITSKAEIRQMWNRISDIDEIQIILERSAMHPQLIYKHSPSCSVSFLAKQELDSKVQELSELADFHIINVIQGRAISNAVAQEFGVRHESPQVLLLKDGEIIWKGSHWQIKGEKLLSALQG